MPSRRVESSLRASFLDGIFASCMLGMTSNYIAAYALALGASAAQVGVLAALPNLASSLAQLKSPDLTERIKNRKKIIVCFVLLHIIMGIPIILVPYFFRAAPVFFLIIFVILFNSLASFAGPPWASLMSDYIPVGKRGQYFGWRNRVMAGITVIAAFVAGYILQAFKKFSVILGFTVIFSLALLCRFISWCFITRMYETPFRPNQSTYFSFLDFIKRIRESNFAKFVIFVASLQFCVNLAAPFFAVLMLRDLKFNYFLYTVILTTTTISSILTIKRWGLHADRVGNLKVLKLTAFIIASSPFLWTLNQTPVYLVLIEALSGFAWAGFNLCALNFIYDAVTSPKRVRCFAYFNVFVGTATCLGALSGGFLLRYMPAVFGYKILGLFLLVSALRFTVVGILSPKIKEVRVTQSVRKRDLFYSMIGLRSILGVRQQVGE